MSKAASFIKYLKSHWFVILLLLLGLHITVFQLIGYDLKKIVGDFGDARFINAIVEYDYQWMIGNYSDYWDGFFMYPDKEIISYSDNLLGIAPFYAVFRLLGFDYLTSFQLLMILCHSLNFLLCYFCFNKMSGNKYAAATGAFIFAFSIALNSVHNHPQYAFRFCVPLFFYFFYTYFNTYRLKYLLYSVIFIVIQFYLGIYLGYFLLISAAIFFVIYPLLNSFSFQKFKKVFFHSLLMAPLFVLCLLPIFYFYYKRHQTSGYYNDYGFYMETMPRLSSYLKAFPNSLTWSFLFNTNVNSAYPWLHLLFPGSLVFVSILFSIFLVFKNVQRRLYASLLLVLIAFIGITLNYDGHTLYGYVMKIPGAGAVRIIARAVIVSVFFPAWLLCLNINYISEKHTRFFKILIVVLPMLLFFDNFCSAKSFKTFNKEESRARVNKLEEKILQTPNYKQYGAFAYTVGPREDGYAYHIDAMLCALKLKWKTVNGYSSSTHGSFGPFAANIDSTSLAGWCNAMNTDIRSILVIK